MSIAQQREELVARVVECVRDIEHTHGVTRESLALIGEVLQDLSGQPQLFPESEFPPNEDPNSNRMYTLSVDNDRRFALYLDCSSTGTETPPHNHTTWAVIAGMKGEEENQFYAPLEAEPGGERGALRPTGSVIVKPGTVVCLLPDDFHSIHVPAGQVNMNFHMYGRSLDTLEERVMFDKKTQSYTHFEAHPDTR